MAHHQTNPEWQRRLQQSSGFKGRSGVPIMESSIQPVVIIDELHKSPDEQLHRRWAGIGGGVTSTGVQLPIISLINPPNSGKLVQVRRVIVTCTIATSILTLAYDNTAPVAGNLLGVYLNQGAAAAPTRSVIGITGTVAAVIPVTAVSFYNVITSANLPNHFAFDAGELVCQPGTQVQMFLNAIGIASLQCGCVWEEFSLTSRG
jgi:hypothetical protein